MFFIVFDKLKIIVFSISLQCFLSAIDYLHGFLKSSFEDFIDVLTS